MNIKIYCFGVGSVVALCAIGLAALSPNQWSFSVRLSTGLLYPIVEVLIFPSILHTFSAPLLSNRDPMDALESQWNKLTLLDSEEDGIRYSNDLAEVSKTTGEH